jgi:hypothetical protein
MSDYLVPMGIVLLGVVGLTVYVLAIALRDTTKRLSDMNEKLMVLIGTRDSGPEVGRALVAMNRKPKKEISGIAEPDKKPDKPREFKLTVGAR